MPTPSTVLIPLHSLSLTPSQPLHPPRLPSPPSPTPSSSSTRPFPTLPSHPSSSTPSRSQSQPARRPTSTTFATASDDPLADLRRVVARLRTAKRVVVICGAGVSTAAQIPDFRSAEGLFRANREDGPAGPLSSSSSVRGGSRDERSALGSDGESGSAIPRSDGGPRAIGKKSSRGRGQPSVLDLFHVKCLTSHTLLPAHHALLNDLWDRSRTASPTSFHHFLARVDAEGRLVRCYTQNIDGLESKVGLSVGVPPRRSRSRLKKPVPTDPVTTDLTPQLLVPSSSLPASPPSSSPASLDPAPSSPDVNTLDPACIPLHGQLASLVCSICSASYPISDFLPLPDDPIACPGCAETSEIRSALRERQRRQGQLRADVVLYGEEHPLGELIGAAVERDLRGRTNRTGGGKVDLLIVAGTTLSIPGVKRIVRELSKSLRPPPPSESSSGDDSDSDEEELEEEAKPTPRRRQPRQPAQPPIRTVFINNEPPARPAEWDGTFDAWVQGDVEQLVSLIDDPSFAAPPKRVKPSTGGKKQTKSKPESPSSSTTNLAAVTTPKRKLASAGIHTGLPTPESLVKPARGDKVVSIIPAPKKRRTTGPATKSPKSERKGSKVAAHVNEAETTTLLSQSPITPFRAAFPPTPTPTPPSPSVHAHARPTQAWSPAIPISKLLANDSDPSGHEHGPEHGQGSKWVHDSSTFLNRDSSPVFSRSRSDSVLSSLSSPPSPTPAPTVVPELVDDALGTVV